MLGCLWSRVLNTKTGSNLKMTTLQKIDPENPEPTTISALFFGSLNTARALSSRNDNECDLWLLSDHIKRDIGFDQSSIISNVYSNAN